MSKIDITVSRDMTVNTGNYSSIKPSVSITVKDIDSKNTNVVFDRLSNVLDDLMMLETVSLSNEMESIQKMGYKEYRDMCENSIEAVGGINNMLKTVNLMVKEIEGGK